MSNNNDNPTKGAVPAGTDNSVAACDPCATKVIATGKWNGFRVTVNGWNDWRGLPTLCECCEDWPADSEVFFAFPN